MTEKNIRTAGKWAFIICAASVAILCGMKGNLVGVFWPIIAAGLHWAATGYQELCDELIEANHDLAEALKKEQAKNAELQEEIIKLKQ